MRHEGDVRRAAERRQLLLDLRLVVLCDGLLVLRQSPSLRSLSDLAMAGMSMRDFSSGHVDLPSGGCAGRRPI